MELFAVPNLRVWLTRCLKRPAARKALALKTKADLEDRDATFNANLEALFKSPGSRPPDRMTRSDRRRPRNTTTRRIATSPVRFAGDCAPPCVSREAGFYTTVVSGHVSHYGRFVPPRALSRHSRPSHLARKSTNVRFAPKVTKMLQRRERSKVPTGDIARLV
jgi:hypothetical protein